MSRDAQREALDFLESLEEKPAVNRTVQGSTAPTVKPGFQPFRPVGFTPKPRPTSTNPAISQASTHVSSGIVKLDDSQQVSPPRAAAPVGFAPLPVGFRPANPTWVAGSTGPEVSGSSSSQAAVAGPPATVSSLPDPLPLNIAPPPTMNSGVAPPSTTLGAGPTSKSKSRHVYAPLVGSVPAQNQVLSIPNQSLSQNAKTYDNAPIPTKSAAPPPRNGPLGNQYNPSHKNRQAEGVIPGFDQFALGMGVPGDVSSADCNPSAIIPSQQCVVENNIDSSQPPNGQGQGWSWNSVWSQAQKGLENAKTIAGSTVQSLQQSKTVKDIYTNVAPELSKLSKSIL
jgi:hypothetical protein